jgi:hypothetical protein
MNDDFTDRFFDVFHVHFGQTGSSQTEVTFEECGVTERIMQVDRNKQVMLKNGGLSRFRRVRPSPAESNPVKPLNFSAAAHGTGQRTGVKMNGKND